MHSLQTMGSARCRHLSVALLLTLTILLLLLYEDASRIKAISIRRTLTTYTQLLVVPTASSSQLLHLPDQTSFHHSKTYAVSDEAAERFGPILRDLEDQGWHRSSHRAEVVFVSTYEAYRETALSNSSVGLVSHIPIEGLNRRTWHVKLQELAVDYGCKLSDLHIKNRQFLLSNVQQCETFFKFAAKVQRLSDKRLRRTSVSKVGRSSRVFKSGELNALKKRYQPCRDKASRHTYETLEIVSAETVGFQVRTYALIASTKPYVVFNRVAYAFKPNLGANGKGRKKPVILSLPSFTKVLEASHRLSAGFLNGGFRERVDKITNYVFQSIRHGISAAPATFHLIQLDFEFTLNGDVRLVDTDFQPTLVDKSEVAKEFWSSMIRILLQVQKGGDTTASQSKVIQSSSWKLIFDEQFEIISGDLYDPCSDLKWPLHEDEEVKPKEAHVTITPQVSTIQGYFGSLIQQMQNLSKSYYDSSSTTQATKQHTTHTLSQDWPQPAHLSQQRLRKQKATSQTHETIAEHKRGTPHRRIKSRGKPSKHDSLTANRGTRSSTTIQLAGVTPSRSNKQMKRKQTPRPPASRTQPHETLSVLSQAETPSYMNVGQSPVSQRKQKPVVYSHRSGKEAGNSLKWVHVHKRSQPMVEVRLVPEEFPSGNAHMSEYAHLYSSLYAPNDEVLPRAAIQPSSYLEEDRAVLRGSVKPEFEQDDQPISHRSSIYFLSPYDNVQSELETDDPANHHYTKATLASADKTFHDTRTPSFNASTHDYLESESEDIRNVSSLDTDDTAGSSKGTIEESEMPSYASSARDGHQSDIVDSEGNTLYTNATVATSNATFGNAAVPPPLAENATLNEHDNVKGAKELLDPARKIPFMVQSTLQDLNEPSSVQYDSQAFLTTEPEEYPKVEDPLLLE